MSREKPRFYLGKVVFLEVHVSEIQEQKPHIYSLGQEIWDLLRKGYRRFEITNKGGEIVIKALR